MKNIFFTCFIIYGLCLSSFSSFAESHYNLLEKYNNLNVELKCKSTANETGYYVGTGSNSKGNRITGCYYEPNIPEWFTAIKNNRSYDIEQRFIDFSCKNTSGKNLSVLLTFDQHDIDFLSKNKNSNSHLVIDSESSKFNCVRNLVVQSVEQDNNGIILIRDIQKSLFMISGRKGSEFNFGASDIKVDYEVYPFIQGTIRNKNNSTRRLRIDVEHVDKNIEYANTMFPYLINDIPSNSEDRNIIGANKKCTKAYITIYDDNGERLNHTGPHLMLDRAERIAHNKVFDIYPNVYDFNEFNKYTPGNKIVMSCTNLGNNIFSIIGGEGTVNNIVLEDIDIYSSGKVAIRSINNGDTYINRVNITKKEGDEQKIVSAKSGFLIPSNRGAVKVYNSVFDSVFDDAGNIFSSYGLVTKIDNMSIGLGKVNKFCIKPSPSLKINVGDLLQVIEPDTGNVHYKYKVTKKVDSYRNDFCKYRGENLSGQYFYELKMVKSFICEIYKCDEKNNKSNDLIPIFKYYKKNDWNCSIKNSHDDKNTEDSTGVSCQAYYMKDRMDYRTLNNIKAKHYLIFNEDSSGRNSRIVGNLVSNNRHNGFAVKSMNTNVISNIFMNIDLYAIRIGLGIRSKNIEGLLPQNILISNNIFHHKGSSPSIYASGIGYRENKNINQAMKSYIFINNNTKMTENEEFKFENLKR